MAKVNLSRISFILMMSVATLCCAHSSNSGLAVQSGAEVGTHDQKSEPTTSALPEVAPSVEATATLDVSASEADPLSRGSQPIAQIAEQARFYERRYQFQNPDQKLVDNVGENYDNLYGARNVREVLKGVLYRGGANNKNNKYEKRNNINPLPDHGVENLCQEGFTRSVYLYKTNFENAKKSVSCQSFRGEKNVDAEFALKRKKSNQFQYDQITAFDTKNEKKFLKLIHDALLGRIESPIYMHCWNGWHASGLVSALSLQQFCGWTPERALDYWTRNTDGNSTGYEKVKARIREFKPYPEFTIPAELQREVCW